MTTETLKVCTVCREVKPREAFYKRRASSDGLQPRCRECDNAKVSAYSAAHPDRVRKQQAAYYDANTDRVRKQQDAYYDANADAILEQQAARRAASRAAGICTDCPEPLAENSTWFCRTHLESRRARKARRRTSEVL